MLRLERPRWCAHLLLFVTPAVTLSSGASSTAVSSLRGFSLSVGNLRDLGGIPLLSGRRIRPNVVLRSASPANLTVSEVAFMQEKVGLRSVIDLRTKGEADKDVGERLLQQTVDMQHLSLFDEAMLQNGLKRKALLRPRLLGALVALRIAKKLSPSRRLRAWAAQTSDRQLIGMLDAIDLEEVYWWMATQRGRQIRQALETCADPGCVPVLVHCTHGKDRTGVLVALLLHVCGAAERTIVEDYAASDVWGCSVEGRWLMQASMPPHLANRVALDPWCVAPEAAMCGLLARLKEEYGSVDRYLDSIGVDAALRSRLECTLTEM